MPFVKVKAVFPEGKFGFYGTRRRYDGDVFNFEYKDGPDAPPVELQLGSWMRIVKGADAKKSADIDIDAEGINDADNNISIRRRPGRPGRGALTSADE